MNLPSWVSVKIGVSYDDSKGWRLKLGRNEHSMIIELDGVSRVKVRQAACEIKKVNSQDAVMVQEIAAETQFV